MFFKPVISLVFSCFVVFPVASESLPEIVEHAQQRLQKVYAVNPDIVASNAKSVNQWLQGPVSIQLTALQSQSDVGTDEYEVGVTLPFRSPLGHQLDDQQTALMTSLTQARERRFSLLVSGIVREALWRRLLAQETLDGLQSKMQWIKAFDQTLRNQYETGEVDRITLLRWKQEKLSHRLAMHKATIALEQATRYYQDITGTDVLPDNPQEAVAQAPVDRLNTHPELRLLSLSQSQLALTLKQADQQLSPWTLGIIGRHLNGPNGNENLLGVALNIPLPTGSSVSVSDHATWRDASNALATATAQTYTVLVGQLRDARQSYVSHKESAAVLTEQVAIGEEMGALFEQRQSSLPRLTWLEQLIKQRDLRVELRKTRMQLQEAIAKINQVAGVSL